MRNKKVISLIVFLVSFFLYSTQVNAEVVTFQRETERCRNFTLTENLISSTSGPIGPGCSFTLDTKASGEWVIASSWFDSPPYGWNSDVYYDTYDGQYAFSCNNLSYVINQDALPSYVQVTKTENITGSATNAPGKRYFFTIAPNAPAGASFALNVGFNAACGMKYEGAVAPAVEYGTDRCRLLNPININPRRASGTVNIKLGSSCQTLEPTRTPTPTRVQCNGSCSNPGQCPLQCAQCSPNGSGGSVCKAGCGQSCSGGSMCPLDCPVCAVNGTCQPAPTLTPTPFPQCGTNCVPANNRCPDQCPYCVGANNTYKCQPPTPTITPTASPRPPTPTPTGVPCNTPCTNAAQCDISCSQCVPGTPGGPAVCKAGCNSPCANASQCPLNCPVCSVNGTCQPLPPTPTFTPVPTVTKTPTPSLSPTITPTSTPTPTPVPCNGSCTNPSQCALECSQCVPNGSGGSVCKAGCGSPCADATQCPQECAQCAPSTTGQGVVCRKEASCNCDGIDFTGEIGPGQTVNTIGYAKVENPDANDAKVLNMVFHVERDGTEIAASDPIPVGAAERTSDANGQAIDRYSSSWNYTIPAEGSGESTYRIFAKISCGYKNVNYASSLQRVIAQGGSRQLAANVNTGRSVLGISTGSVLGAVTDWWNNLMGFNPITPTPPAIVPGPTLTPLQAQQYVFEALDSPIWYTPARPESMKFDSLKLGTFNPNVTPTPAPIIERACKQVKFTLFYP